MFDNLVTYHVHTQTPLPPSDALAYQYVLAGNGVFVRARTRFFDAVVQAAACTVRGLPPLQPRFRLLVPRLPERLLHAILADARRARRADGGLNEALYQVRYRERRVRVVKPPQRVSATRVVAAARDAGDVLADIHSHGRMAAFFSATDDADEQGARLYGVIGRVDGAPEMRLRLGLYSCRQSLPLTSVFSGCGPFRDLHQKKQLQ